MRKVLTLSVAAVIAACGSQPDSQSQSSDVQSPAIATHHQPAAVLDGSAAVVGKLSETQTLNLDIVLPVRDVAGLASFVDAVTDPNNANYQNYLTPSEFTTKFGPTQADYDAVVNYALQNGLDVMGGSRDGMDVQVTGTVSAIETAFKVRMQNYQDPNADRVFYAPDREPTTTLKFALWHISGLDNYSIPQPMMETREQYAAKYGIDVTAMASTKGTGSGPSGSFLGSDMRAAYYGGTALTGAGQNLGLFEYAGTDLADLTTYYKNAGQTNKVPVSLLSVDGTSTACVDSKAGGSCDDGEQNLDMTQALGMAPGLASLVVYIGNTDTAIISAMTTHSPLPTTIGCSWGWTPADASTLDPYFEKMAAQGQTFFVASGDDSTWKKTGNAAAWPADDAHIVSVGGTDLTMKSGAWSSETAWADSGGGISPDKIAIPSWQTSAVTTTNKGSKTYRNGPDVSANANFTFYTCGDQAACQANEYGGTSFAAPMWAGYIALLNQARASEKKAPVGFFLPTIYSANANATTYGKSFHDIKSGTSGSYSAETGFDLVTGWGSPQAGLITSLE